MDELDDYIRMPFPTLHLTGPDGQELELAELVRERACLVVLVPDHAQARSDALAAVDRWQRQLTRIAVRPLFLHPPLAHISSTTDPGALYSGEQLRASLDLGRDASAVLLGADGLLAGGPVSGLPNLERFVDDIMAAVGDTREGAPPVDPLPVSCKCITYGRVSALEESLASFLKQDYDGEHELVIVNDYPLQRLHFEHPRVRIYNLDFTFPTIGAKENFAVSACRFDTIAVWDDDDIALQGHLRNISKYFPGHDLLHWERGAYLEAGTIRGLTSLGNSGIVYSRPLWLSIGGHPSENAGYDVTFVNRLRAAGARVAKADPPPSEVGWFYRWGDGSYHMSGQGTDDGSRPHVLQRHADHIESLRVAGKIPTGDIELKPQWRRDYRALLSEYCDPNRLQ